MCLLLFFNIQDTFQNDIQQVLIFIIFSLLILSNIVLIIKLTPYILIIKITTDLQLIFVSQE